jgi:hypothetical protein
MIFNQPITDIIKQRYSCRKYKESAIDEPIVNNIKNFIFTNNDAPFKSQIRLVVASSMKGDSEELKGLGTYGFIRNPAGFIIGIGEPSEKYLEDFGYLMEKNILYATSLGIGSCWLGASFKKSSFENRAQINGSEEVLAVVAFGYSSENKSIFDRIVRFSIKAGSRKPWNELFYDGDFSAPLERNTDKYAEVLEMTRLAPSAGNLQPWRIVKDRKGCSYHFYLERKKGYDKLMTNRNRADLQRIDMGIAMCHFDHTAREMNLAGVWEIADPEIGSNGTLREYIASWKGI